MLVNTKHLYEDKEYKKCKNCGAIFSSKNKSGYCKKCHNKFCYSGTIYITDGIKKNTDIPKGWNKGRIKISGPIE